MTVIHKRMIQGACIGFLLSIDKLDVWDYKFWIISIICCMINSIKTKSTVKYITIELGKPIKK